MLTDAQVSTTADEVVSGAQSRYGPAAPLVHVHRLLDAGRRFAVIGKPCDMAAIRNLARIDDRVETQIPYCLTIFCGGLPTSHTARKIADHYGVQADEVDVFRFRGNGWPGPTHVKAKDVKFVRTRSENLGTLPVQTGGSWMMGDPFMRRRRVLIFWSPGLRVVKPW